MTQPVAITASITRTGSASGVVSFLDAGAPIDGCQEVAVITPSASPSIATCTATLTAGVHAIAAAYSGDVTHAPQISDALIQRITPDGTTTLVEFFNARLDDYFLTSEAEEIAALDSGATPGWTRTGQSFLAFAPDANRVKPMCRWFSGSTFAPVSVHFYSVSEGECYRPAGAWVFEANVAPVLLPQPAGFCPTGTTQLYRLYNNSQDGVSRHRYTTSLAEWLAMTQRGWIGEGEGMGVMACVPT
jgi:serine protease